MSMRWYVVHAYSGYEKKVALAIQDRVQMQGLTEEVWRDFGAYRRSG